MRHPAAKNSFAVRGDKLCVVCKHFRLHGRHCPRHGRWHSHVLWVGVAMCEMLRWMVQLCCSAVKHEAASQKWHLAEDLSLLLLLLLLEEQLLYVRAGLLLLR
jgi:hypothetical protein